MTKKPSRFETEVPQPANAELAWGSDAAAHMLRAMGLRYLALNPGASFRGLHDSLVNYLGNRDPQILLVLHEMHAVAIAHGYSKVAGNPMGAVLHSNVGLLNGSMSVFNAWADRAPVIILGATGHVDAAKRRPWIEWLHTSRDQGALIRDFTKWDDQPGSAEAAVESLLRAHQISTTVPMGPTYVNLEVDWQEAPLDHPMEFPDPARFVAGPPPAADADTLQRAVSALKSAKRPVLLFGRGRRDDAAWAARVALAERLGARVLTDLKLGATFPTTHPLHAAAPSFVPDADALAVIADADVIAAFDWVDLGGALANSCGGRHTKTTVINCSLDAHLHRGWSFDYHILPPADLRVMADPDAFIAQLVDRLPARSEALPARTPGTVTADPTTAPSDELTLSDISAALDTALAQGTRSLVRVPLGWPAKGCRFEHPLDYVGFDGGGGVGSGPGMAVGAALALADAAPDRIAVAVMGDGDFLMGATAIWTAAKYRIPLLILVANNRSYLNDEIHQDKVARIRSRPPSNRWVGQRIENPAPDIAMLARGQGATGQGPVTDLDALRDAMEVGVAAVRDGGVHVIDVHIRSAYESKVSADAAPKSTEKEQG